MSAKGRALLIYNICGIKLDNTDKYPIFLSNIAEQKFDGELVVVVSACKPHDRTVPTLKQMFPQFDYNTIHDAHPVNVTCNHSVLEAVKRHGEFDTYIYQSCDSFMLSDDTLQGAFDILTTNPTHGMVAPQIDIDSCYAYGLKLGGGRHVIDDEKARYEMFKDGTDYIVPPGKACASHLLLYDKKVFDFYGKIIPDIFASHCTESVFTFVAGALGLNWVILREQKIHHASSMDGPSWGFRPEGRDLPDYDHPIPQYGESMIHIFECEEARRLGLGYEECKNLIPHDPSQFDENGHCVNDELKHYIKNNLYVSKEVLDYDSIKSDYYAAE